MAGVLMCVRVCTLVAQNFVELLGIDIVILAAHVCDVCMCDHEFKCSI